VQLKGFDQFPVVDEKGHILGVVSEGNLTSMAPPSSLVAMEISLSSLLV